MEGKKGYCKVVRGVEIPERRWCPEYPVCFACAVAGAYSISEPDGGLRPSGLLSEKMYRNGRHTRNASKRLFIMDHILDRRL